MEKSKMMKAVLGRRNFVGTCAATLATVSATPALASQIPLPAHPPHSKSLPRVARKGEKLLSFENLHTGERLRRAYWENGSYVPEVLKEINHVMRDHRTGDIHRIDPKLLDLLYRLHNRLGSSQPFQIISGYRSPRTNDMLRHKSSGVARRSLHMDGMAVDICLEDRRLVDIRRAALDMQAGGVGYYPRSNFVHVDVGQVRSW